MATYYVDPAGNDTTGDGSSGNPWASPGKAAGSMSAGDICRIQPGTYLIGNGTANTSGNRVSWNTGGSASAVTQFVGWGGRPVLEANASSITICGTGGLGSYAIFRNLEFKRDTAGGLTSVRGFQASASRAKVIGCIARGCNNDGFVLNTLSHVEDCLAIDCDDGFVGTSVRYYGCTAINITNTGFAMNGTDCMALRCASVAANLGFTINGNAQLLAYCLAHGSTSHGFTVSGTFNPQVLLSCLATSNGGTAFALSTSPLLRTKLCASWNNTGGDYTGDASQHDDFITLSADPFTNAAGLDFSLNSTAGGGALLKGVGWPQSFPGLAGTSYPDIGAYQSQGGGGTTYFLF